MLSNPGSICGQAASRLSEANLDLLSRVSFGTLSGFAPPTFASHHHTESSKHPANVSIFIGYNTSLSKSSPVPCAYGGWAQRTCLGA